MNLNAVIEYGAVISAAIYGVLLAHRKGLDFVGVFAVAFVVSFGGGTLRDLFLDRTPLFWVANQHFAILVFTLALTGTLFPRLAERLESWLAVPDALGLGLFTVMGTRYAMEADTPLFIAAILGVVTGAFGGVLGDVICNEIPRLFRPAPLYATCSFSGAWVYILTHRFLALPEDLCSLSAVIATVAFRLVAVKWAIQLPATGGPPDKK